MEAKSLFVLSVLTLAINQAVYATDNMLQEVQVTSTTIDDRFDSKRGEASNINNISGRKVDDEHGKSIVDILESVPGVTAELQSGDSVKIMLRGVETQRYMGEKPGVAIVIDGVPVNERTGRVNIDLDNIDSIKVIKGGASYLFGEDALSGAVIITTKRGAKMAGVTTSIERGIFNYNKNLARVGFARGDWIGHIQNSTAYSDDYYDQGQYYRGYWNGKLQYLIDDSSDISFGFEKSTRRKDSHGTVTGVTNAWLDPRSTGGGKDYARMYDVHLDKMNLNYTKDIGENGNLMVAVYQYLDHTIYKSNPSGTLRNANGTPLYGTVAASNMALFKDVYASLNDGNQVQKGIKSEWRNGGEKVGLMAGLDLRSDSDHSTTTTLVTYTASGAPRSVPTLATTAGSISADNIVTTRTKGVYGELKWEASNPLTLTLNARYDDIGAGFVSHLPAAAGKITSGQKTFRVWSERLGANYELTPNHEVYSNFSTGFRVPTATQLYGSTITPTGAVLSNPNLNPEHAFNQEIGLRTKSELFGIALDSDVAIYQIDRKDFILNTGGQYQTSPTSIVEQYQNIGGVRNRGIELAVKSDAKRTWSGDIAYTYLDAVFTRNDTYWMSMGPRGTPLPSVLYNNTGHVVPRSPKHRINLSTHYRATDAWTFTAEVNAQSGIFADEVNKVWIGGRTVANLASNYDLKAGDYKVTAFARIDNLFNRYYYSTIRGGSDSNGDGVYNANDPSITVNAERVWTAGLSVKF